MTCSWPSLAAAASPPWSTSSPPAQVIPPGLPPSLLSQFPSSPLTQIRPMVGTSEAQAIFPQNLCVRWQGRYHVQFLISSRTEGCCVSRWLLWGASC